MEDPTCLRCEEQYSVRDGCDPTTFCDRCAHDIAESALAFAIAFDERGDGAKAAMVNLVNTTRPR